MTLALYTTIYPGVERFLAGWYASVLGQTDRDFELWVGLDGVDPETAMRHMVGVATAEARPGCAATQAPPRPARGGRGAASREGLLERAVWLQATPGDSIAQVRQHAWERLVERCDEVVLVDSDDLLLPTRVATARRMLRECDLAGCPLDLVDEAGDALGVTFDSPCDDAAGVLPRHNVFGLSNSAYRSALLRRCLPVPAEAVLVDWYLATRAWLLGARMAFGSVVEMRYRQHGANMVRVAPPFAATQVAHDTERVRRHFTLIVAHGLEGALPERRAALMEAAAAVDTFYDRVVLEPALLERYVEALNALGLPPLWWSSVAHRSLQHLWMPLKERT